MSHLRFPSAVNSFVSAFILLVLTDLCATKMLVHSGLRDCVKNGDLDSLAQWADQACNGLKFIDEDYEDDSGIIRIR
jgi:hypothetical protein